MKKSEAAKRIQIFLETRGYCGNCDDGEALVDFLVDDLGMSPPPVDLHDGYEFIDCIFWEDEDEQTKD